MVQFYIKHLLRNTQNQYEYIKEVSCFKEVAEYLTSIGEEQESYQRFWVEGADLVIDYGSWSKYVVIHFDSEDAAMAYIASDRSSFC